MKRIESKQKNKEKTLEIFIDKALDLPKKKIYLF